MADAVVHHPAEGAFEAPFLGAYSKKLGMWLFLLSDTLTFGALLFAYSYGRVATVNWPTPFGKASIINASVMTACLLSSSVTMVLAVLAAGRRDRAWVRYWLVATMIFGTAFIVLHAMEWNNLRTEGLTLAIFPAMPHVASEGELAKVASTVPQFPGTFFALTGMHMLHVTIGVVYLGVLAFGRKWLPGLVVLAGICFFLPSYSVFHWLSFPLIAAIVVCGIILWLKPKDYDAHDIEVGGLYWHFVDLVWMFIFPLVYLMSTKIV
jgi:heme/copper-type cytochrome/quinol oxidase subunit 3